MAGAVFEVCRTCPDLFVLEGTMRYLGGDSDGREGADWLQAGPCGRHERAFPRRRLVKAEMPPCSWLLTRAGTTALKFPGLWGLVSGFLRAGHGLAACWSRRRDGIRWSLK